MRLVCRCGKTTVQARAQVDVETLKALAIDALGRARVHVYAVPIAEPANGFTLAVERDPRVHGGLSKDDARRYAAAINGEAELARAVLPLIAELEQLRAIRQESMARHGSGTMPRVGAPEDARGDDEEKAG